MNSVNPVKKILYIILAALNAICIITAAILYIVFMSMSSRLASQNISESWSGEDGEKYDQLSVFFADGYGIGYDEVRRIRTDLEKKLTENSLEARNDNSRLYIYSFSCTPYLQTVTTMSDSYAPNVEAETIVTGGDFFLFHPLLLISGSYYSDDELMQDRVVINDVLAWQLFGASEVSGMAVKINGRIYSVAGVVTLEDDKASDYLVGGKPYMFMPFDTLSETPPTAKCFEAVLPSPVKDLAKTMLTDAVGVEEENCSVIVNSSRFSFLNCLKAAFDGGRSAVVDKSIVYPYWENAARITLANAADTAAAIVLLAAVPILTVLYFAGLLFHKRKAIIHNITENIRDKYDDLSEKMRKKQRAAKVKKTTKGGNL